MRSTPLIWFASGAATVCSSTCAEAPGYKAVTVTTGGAISGYCATGSTRIAASPAMMMNTESTAAKIGRSMKKRDSIELLFRCGVRRVLRFCDLRRSARAELKDTVGDHALAGLEPRGDHPGV